MATSGPRKEALIVSDPVWGEISTWKVIKRASHEITPYYLLSVLDQKQNDDGTIYSMPEDRSIYVQVLTRTLGIGFLVTLCTLLLGYPVAYMLATLPQRTASILMIFVLLPFWTSLLVRTAAWTILLQDGGAITQFLHLNGITWVLNALGFMAGDPHSIALHIATYLQRNENHLAHLFARRKIIGRQTVSYLPHCLCATNFTGHCGGLFADIHSESWLFYHAIFGGWPHR
jgi:hypothetical protein